MGSAKISSETIVLPAHLRLPDLARVDRVTRPMTARWMRQARRAALWGPDERNGCIRDRAGDRVRWYDRDGLQNSPDEWTPSGYDGFPEGEANWYQHGIRGRLGDQPAHLGGLGLAWIGLGRAPFGVVHREHGPSELLVREPLSRRLTHLGQPPARWRRWRWYGWEASEPLAALLDSAWSDRLDAAGAASLVSRAGRTDPGDMVQVAPEAWVARVLLAGQAANLTVDLHRWLLLLTT